MPETMRDVLAEFDAQKEQRQAWRSEIGELEIMET